MVEFKYIVRIANADLKGEKAVGHALKGVRGLGFIFANVVCSVSGVDKNIKIGDLDEEQIKKLNDVIKDPLKYNIPRWMLNRRKDYESGEDVHIVTSDINFIQDNDIKRLKKIKCYKGMRHAFGLPVRGQRTRSNFRKNKGKVMGVKRSKKAGKK